MGEEELEEKGVGECCDELLKAIFHLKSAREVSYQTKVS
jgi:hypothetical protein